MHALVTGGAGFIGSHLCERLIAAGSRVTVLDDLSTGRVENVGGLFGAPGFELRRGSVTDRELVDELVAPVDLVVHLAAVVGVKLVVEAPVRTVDTNVLGTAAVLGAAAKHAVPVLLASSSEVYGKSPRVPFREDDELVLGPTTVSRFSYACSKAQGEWLARAHHAEHGLPVAIARLFNTVGPRQRGCYGMVLPRFVAQALAGEAIEVYGDGRQTRCFGHVDDTVEALLRLAERIRAPHVVGRVFNVGNDQEVTIGALAEHVRHAARSTSQIVHVPHERVFGPAFCDLRRRVPDIARLEHATGFRPRIPLERIVRDVVEEARGRAAV